MRSTNPYLLYTSLLTPVWGKFWGNRGKSKIEDQRLVDTLMLYRHANNFPIISRGDKQTHRQRPRRTIIDLLVLAERSVDQQYTLASRP